MTFKAFWKTQGDAVVRVSIEDDLPVLRFDVELYGIPYNKKVGHEVTVNFLAPELDNKGVFYTDSNGLAMQKRILNYRPTWDLDLTANQNITANYYPVGSAIALVDLEQDWQLTVMNSRSQGGSVINRGRIELMQNRRINKDDGRGMGEPLNETDANGDGISVPATYYVQLFNRSVRASSQRVMQQRQDSPAEYFFSFNAAQTSTKVENVPHMVKGSIGKVYRDNGINDQMKVELFAMGANQLLMRVENIADVFDSKGEVIYTEVNVFDIARQLYALSNDVSMDTVHVHLIETSLTANQNYADMEKTKLHWNTVDDNMSIDSGLEDGETFMALKFQQQRMRTFKAKFHMENVVDRVESFLAKGLKFLHNE